MVCCNSQHCNHGTSLGKLDLETIRKRVSFSMSSDVDLSRGGVYDPDAVDDLITWLEGNRRQDVVIHQIADSGW